ncbi:MAG: DUF547 domain-containing protein [Ketobacter sp.]|nr:DUF547 domain-containing protein [Ketobacter sp.]
MNKPLSIRFTFINLPNLAKLAALIFMVSMNAPSVWAAPAAQLWPHWNNSDESSTASIDHQHWQLLLDQYLKVSGDPLVTRFDYANVTVEHRALLTGYINRLQSLPILQYKKAEQQAYWINLYNALTVDLILSRYPVASIRKIKFGFFSFGPWDEKLAEVDGQPLSLNDIEHRILRPIWQDNRIHYAVNCASISCPNLAPQAFTRANTESLLHEGAINYINHPRAVAFVGSDLKLSTIYDWYQDDFGGSEQGVIQHLLRYAKPELAGRLRSHAGDIDYDYDWGLNSP